MRDPQHEEDSNDPLFGFECGVDYVSKPRPDLPWVIEPIVSPGAKFVIYGQPKAGKSLLMLGLAIAATGGQETHWMNRFPIHEPGRPWLWLEADNSPSEWVNVLKGVVAEGHDVSNIFFADRDMIPYPFDLLDPEGNHGDVLWDMVMKFTKSYGAPPACVVIDTMRAIHSGDEDKSSVIAEVLKQLTAAVKDVNAALGIIAHSRKGGGLQAMKGEAETQESFDNDTSDVMSENRGSNAFVADMQTVIRVTANHQKGYGWFTAQGRNMGRSRIRMTQKPPSYLWHAEADPAMELILSLNSEQPDLSQRQIAKEVAQIMKLPEEKVRHMVRRALKTD